MTPEASPNSESKSASLDRSSFPPASPNSPFAATPSSFPLERTSVRTLLSPAILYYTTRSSTLPDAQSVPPPHLPPRRVQSAATQAAPLRIHASHACVTFATRRSARNKSAHSSRIGFNILRPRGNNR